MVELKNTTFDPKRIEELDLLDSFIDVEYLYNKILRSGIISQRLFYNDISNAITLELEINTISRCEIAALDIENSIFKEILYTSIFEDTDIMQIDLFAKYYNRCYNYLALRMLDDNTLLNNASISCFGLIKNQNNEVIGTIDDINFNTKNITLMAMTSYCGVHPGDKYNIDLYIGKDQNIKIMLNNIECNKIIKDGIVKQCSVGTNDSINYDKVNYDIDFKISREDILKDKSKIDKFIEEREQFLDVKKDNIINMLNKNLFEI